jgi:hypothetical protein
MPIEFITLPDSSHSELQSLANLLLSDLKRRGYKVKPEPSQIELPSTPTILATRHHETNYFLVVESIIFNDVAQWVRFSQSCTRDTRVTLCCDKGDAIPASHITRLRTMGVKLLIRAEGRLQVVCEGRDLAFHAAAPDRNFLKPRVRVLLGEALDRLEDGDWRTAFSDACIVLEEECRVYLLRNHGMNRVKYKSGNKIKVPTKKQIKKMTLGALKEVFCGMKSQNQIEAALCSALERLNPDRIKRVHKPRTRWTEDALRRRVGIHIWLINNSLSLLV